MEMTAIPNGFKMTELGMLPEEWVVVSLEEISEVKGGKRLPKGHTFADHSSQYPYIRVIDFKNYSIDESNLKFLTQEDGELLKRYTISSKDVYISIAGTIGLSGFVPDYLDNANLTENAAKIIINDETQMDKYFLTYFLQCHKGQEQITIRTSKTSQPKLALIRIKQIPIPLPPLPEQQKIAEVLSTVQQAKEKTDTVISATKELKKSLMKHLFTYGPVPVNEFNELGEFNKFNELRVDELQNAQNSKNSSNSSNSSNSKNSINLKETEIGLVPEEWDIAKLGDVAEQRKETTNPRDGDWKYVGLEHIDPGESHLKRYGFSNEVRSSKSKFYSGDILYGKLRPYLDKGVLVDLEGICSTDIIVIKTKENLNETLLAYLVHINEFREYATKTMTGVNHPRTSWRTLSQFYIPLPPLSIQQKIASILSTVDEKIEKAENKKKALEALFKTLLHDLMTAKFRVNHLEVTL
jgi:type I restriction enzyme S subunit